MQNLSLYMAKDTYIHQHVDPITKLIYFLCVSIAVFFIPSLTGLALLVFINIALLGWAKELLRTSKIFLTMSILLLSIFIIQGMYHPDNHTLLWSFGPIHFYQEGLWFAIKVTLRMMNILAATSLLVLTASPSDIMEALMRRGMSPKIGYMITSILQIIPVMVRSATTIQEAQKSRGMVMEGNLLIRLKAFVPLITPLILSSLVSIQERAMALEVRGFSAQAKKTYLHEEKIMPAMKTVRLIIILLTIGAIIWGILV